MSWKFLLIKTQLILSLSMLIGLDEEKFLHFFDLYKEQEMEFYMLIFGWLKVLNFLFHKN